ncbi:MAG: prolyl oligopeptidase family serine peptidase [Anaerolineae bacterium]|nr:prolyl oligopeptidase family serine peptidase [Anaerolineae bacterium]
MNKLGVVLYAGYCVVLVVPSGWFLLTTPTWVGRLIGLTGFVVVGLPLSGWLWARTQRLIWRRLTLGLAVFPLLAVATVLLRTPPGVAPSDSPVQQRFSRPGTRFSRYMLSNIVPEAEQIHLGFLWAVAADPYFTAAQSRRVTPFTMELYREMERDRDFRALGSAMGWAYAELFGFSFDVGHYFLYIPRNHGEGPLPSVVFLHGSVGNFKTYTWIWSKFAEEHGFVIVAPSFGFGNWNLPGGDAAVFRALDDAQRVLAESGIAIDPARLYLAGISNGGIGVSRVGLAAPERFAGLIYLSPVMPSSIVDGAEFSAQWAQRPVLVIAGMADERIPLSYVRERAAVLRDASVDVTLREYPDEDHFLFFSQPEAVLRDVADWLPAE